MEYKGPHKDLDKAYQQLLLYREELENPPLLITSDLRTIVIHTNFTNRPTKTHIITFDRLLNKDGLDLLKRAFFNPESFKPENTQQAITKASADTFVDVADMMKKHQQVTGESYSAEQLAHFMVRLLFCLFAEDMQLLPDQLFTQLLKARGKNKIDLQTRLSRLFEQMRTGGDYGFYQIRYFDGTLFDDEFVPDLPEDLTMALLKAADQDWSEVDPSIFGTLFERVIDEGKRAQLGAHYTSKSDIDLIVEPVLMAPLREQWRKLRFQCVMALEDDTNKAEVQQKLVAFAEEIAQMRVLDPACGSGNFLYVALQNLLALQKEVIVFAERRGLPNIELTVSPSQLYGIEINVYAHELAQITAWIGYLQWRKANGFAEMDDPILRPLYNIKRMDAILAYDKQGKPIEPEWPEADVIIGNPPFLGGNKIRQELGNEWVDDLFVVYEGRVPAFADLVCYWFERTRKQISKYGIARSGLIATNSIRGGANRIVLANIKSTGDIFFAWSDRPWILDGASVRVSIIGFDNGVENIKYLDGKEVSAINSDLTSQVDITQAEKLSENEEICFMGPSAKGAFDIDEILAKKFISEHNENGASNSDIIRPVYSATDIVRNNRGLWTIDFALMSLEKAQNYQAPLQYVRKHVYPIRSKNRRATYAKYWWRYGEPRPGMRQAIKTLERFCVTPAVAKHRLFVWVKSNILCNQGTLIFAREDDYFFGVLHSKLHEMWSLRMGTWLGKGNDPRYTPTTTFETFPFPWPPGQEPTEDERVKAIAYWAKQLNEWREAWLNPPPPKNKTVGSAYENMLKKRTLTNLYNGLQYVRNVVLESNDKLFDTAQFSKVTRGSVSREQVEHLHQLHTELDNAVLDAYGWPHNLDEEGVLSRLLALNLERAKNETRS